MAARTGIRRNNTLSRTLPLLALALMVVATLALAGSAFALEVPASPKGRVSDYAGVLGSAEERQLEEKLAAVEHETTNQFAIAIFESLEGEALEDFSIRLADQWTIGQAGKDNGLILLLFMKERKIRIEVGYGLEGSIPDVLAGRVIREVMGPKLKAGDFAGGLYAAVVSLDKAARGDLAGVLPKQSARSKRSRGNGNAGTVVIFLIFFGVAIINMIARARYGAAMVSSRRGSGIPWWLWLLMLSGGSRRRGGGFGGGFGGGGFGGGGFGGGGGGFGGGGASGGW